MPASDHIEPSTSHVELESTNRALPQLTNDELGLVRTGIKAGWITASMRSNLVEVTRFESSLTVSDTLGSDRG